MAIDVAEHELLAVVGPSGSGKSTLLRVIAGLEPLEAGSVRIAGRDVTAEPPARRGVAMVFQSFALLPHMDVAANIGFGLEAQRLPAAERRARVQEAAERLGLAPLLGRRPAQLSGGERQRVALARGLAARPAVLLLDEPFSNLDARLRREARVELRRVQREQGITMVHVTHDQAEALTLGDRVAVLQSGRVAQAGTPDEVYSRPVTTFVAGFLGSPPMNLFAAGALPVVCEQGAATAGFRPEDAVLGGAEGFEARLDLVEAAGHDIVCHLVHGSTRFAVRLPSLPAAREGETVRVQVPGAALRAFDADGRSLA